MTTTGITLRSPSELLALVPYILGFRPTSSLVLLCLRQRRLGLTQRLDLPRPEHAHQVVPALLPSLVAENPDSVILIGYEAHADDSLPALEALTAALESRQTEIHDRIVVRNGRWRSLDCHSPDCCPPSGNRVPESADVPGIVSEFVGRGVAPHPDREALASQLEPGPQAMAVAKVLRSRQKAMAKGVDSQESSRAELFAAWPRILDPEASAISPDDAALAAMSLRDIEIRDGLVAWLSPGTLNADELSADVQELLSGVERGWDDRDCNHDTLATQNRAQDALIHLCAMLPDHAAAPALSLLSSFAWWRGDGALARVALARALHCDPDYRLAQLLLRMVDLGIRPLAP